ncbi:tetratricopeptide repeat protein [Actinoplanes sp. NPDC048796]|uniref:tetratricopeptide repeat protein n=1 Tax=Actinoplanes sp. NPDC048796 TaxID=3155640 RepID=UPI0033EF1999
MGGLPLALRLAGMYIAETAAAPWPDPAATFSGYRAALEDGNLPDALIGRTWELSLDLLDRRGLIQARPLLRLLSQFAEAPIPYRQLLRPEALAAFEQFAGLDARRLWELLRALAHVGLIDLTEPATLRLHPLVRRVGRHQGSLADQAAALLHSTAEEEGYQSSEDPRHWSFWEAFAPHSLHMVEAIADLPVLTAQTVEHAAFAAQMTGLYLRARRLYAQATVCHQTIVDNCQAVLGDRHIGIMAPRHSLAALLHTRGRLDEAELLYREVLADRRAALGDEHRHTLATRHQLAFLLFDRSRLDEAEAEWQTVFTVNEEACGPDHMLTLNSRYMLARVWHARG